MAQVYINNSPISPYRPSLNADGEPDRMADRIRTIKSESALHGQT